MRYVVRADGNIERAWGERLTWLISLGAYVADSMMDAIAYARAMCMR